VSLKQLRAEQQHTRRGGRGGDGLAGPGAPMVNQGRPFALPGLTSGPAPRQVQALQQRAPEQDHEGAQVAPVPTSRDVADAPDTPQLQPELVPTRAGRDLQPKDILAVLGTSSYLKSKLKASTHAQARIDPKKAPKESMGVRLKLILDQVDAMFAQHPEGKAMSLAIGIDRVAAVIASELYDPSLRPKIADDLFAVYGPKLEAALGKKKVDEPAEQVALARILAAVDPVSLYMHGEKRLQDAAWEIKEAAQRAGKKPDHMFDLYRKRFEAEMASYTTDQVDAQEDKSGAFNLKESPGELSKDYFKRLFGDAGPDGKAKKGAKGLTFTPAAAAQLDALQKEVSSTASDTRPKNADERRKQMFAEVSQSDADVKDLRERHVIQALQKKAWGLSKEQAEKVVARLKSPQGLAKVPLTITHWAGRRSAALDKAGGSVDSTRSAERKAVPMAQTIGKKHTKATKALGTKAQHSIGKYEDKIFGAQRGERYGQFRAWKDSVMSGNMGLSGDELPIYGAMNVTFDKYGGTGGVMSLARVEELRKKLNRGKKLTQDEQAYLDAMGDEHDRLTAVSKDEDLSYGVNYYGDMHLKLKRDKVESRVLYTAGDHGQPHRDPFLAFADFLVGTVVADDPAETYYSDRTALKRTGDRPTGVFAGGNARAMLATVLGAEDVARMELPFEIQIYGGVDWATDVEAIWVSPGAPKDAFDRLETWSKAVPGRPEVKRMERPKNVNVVSQGNIDLAKVFGQL
jgi:hypothetical protein